MSPLLRKELRELAPAALAAIGIAALLTLADVAYNWQHPYYRGIGATIWLVIAFGLAFLGGASAIARETIPQLVFLTSWPYSRAALWLTKALVSFVVTMLVLIVGFAICLSVADFSEPDVKQLLGQAEVWWLLACGLPACFAFALMWSSLLRATLGAAALGALTAFLTVLGFVGFGLYVSVYWGPYLSGGGGDDPTPRVQALGLLLLISAAGAGAYAFSRFPILDASRRLRHALAVFVACVVLLALGQTAYQIAFRRPALRAPLVTAWSAANGAVVLAQTAPGADVPGGLWAISVSDGRARLLARMGQRADVWPPARIEPLVSLPLKYGGNAFTSYWAADLATGRLRRLRGEPAASSPDDRYWLVAHGDRRLAIQDHRGRLIAALPQYTGRGFLSPESRYLYYETYQGVIQRLDVRTRETTVVATVGSDFFPTDLSPDGRLLAGVASPPVTSPRFRVNITIILDTATGAVHRVPGLSPRAFVSDRYLWCREGSAVQSEERGLAVIDTRLMRVTNRISYASLGDNSARIWQHPEAPHCMLTVRGHGRPKDMPPPQEGFRLWLTNRDGSGLRLLREETRVVLGMTAAGTVLLWHKPGTFYEWNPITNAERIIRRL